MGRLHAIVQDSLTQRVAETITLLQHLSMGEADNRTAFNRNARHYEMTDTTRGYNLGPVAYSDLQTRERLERPMVKVYQRHPGTNVPDARDLIRANSQLEESLEQTQKNLALLHLSNIRIKEDQRDKGRRRYRLQHNQTPKTEGRPPMGTRDEALGGFNQASTKGSKLSYSSLVSILINSSSYLLSYSLTDKVLVCPKYQEQLSKNFYS